MNHRKSRKDWSLILLPPGDLGSKILELAEVWTRNRLLVPALYAICNEQNETESAADRITQDNLIGFILGFDRAKPCDIFEFLSSHEVKSLKIAAVNDCTSKMTKPNAFSDRVNEIQSKLRKSVARFEGQGTPQESTDLLFLNCFALQDAQYEMSQIVVDSNWDFNVIFSTEDRKSPAGLDLSTNSDKNTFPGLVLSNIASATCLWITQTESPFEKVERSRSSEKVFFQRNFTRAVKTDDIAYKVTARSLREMEIEGNPCAYRNYSGEMKLANERERAVLISDFVRQTMQKGLSLEAFAERPQTFEKTKIGFGEGVSLFGRFFFSNLVSIPRNFFTSIVELFNSKATDFLFGKNGEFEIELRKSDNIAFAKLRNYGLLQEERNDINEIYESKKRVSEEQALAKRTSSSRTKTPELWKFIREESTNLLQGSYSISDAQLKNIVVENPKFLIPSESDKWEVPAFTLFEGEEREKVEAQLDWLDVVKANQLANFYEQVTKDIEFELESASMTLKDSIQEKRIAKIEHRKAEAAYERVTNEFKSLTKLLDSSQEVMYADPDVDSPILSSNEEIAIHLADENSEQLSELAEEETKIGRAHV